MEGILRAAGACVLAFSLASCGGSGGGATSSGIDAAGKTIPKHVAPPVAKQPATVTTASGAPKIVQFKMPRKFWCLHADPGQAQVIVGWSAPSATRADVFLDGARVRSGIRKTLPFSVPAGPPPGIGATVVFACRSGGRHRIAIRWRAHGSPPAERTVTITKATGP